MSNPFDSFAADFQAALPPGAPGAQPPTNDPPIFSAPAPAAPPQPVMNAPPQMGGPPVGYGAPPPPAAATPFGAPPPPAGNEMYSPYGQPPTDDGQSGYAQPPGQPPMQPPSGNDMYAAYGQPPPPGPPAAPTPATSGGYPGGAPYQEPQAANPFGAAPVPPAPAPPTEAPGGEQFQPSASGSSAPDASQAAPGYSDPWGSGTSAPPPSQPTGGPPAFGAPPSQPNPANPGGQSVPAPGAPDPSMGAIVPAGPANPYAAVPDPSMGAIVPAQPQANPYGNPYAAPPVGPYGAPPGPYGAPMPGPYGHPQPPPQPAAIDPFSVFEAQSKPPEPAPVPAPAVPEVAAAPPAAEPAAPAANASDDDFWGSFSANAPAPEPAPAATTTKSKGEPKVSEEKKDDGLPPGGEWYDARIFTPTLGVMFFKPQELTDSLFLNTDRSIVDALGDRPVVAFIVEGSSARSAGVELGHVLLKVNGVDVKNPKEASRLIKEGPRPLPLLFYVPNTDIVVAEGEHMVKYDTRETTAPNSAKDWKPKYVVIGGIIAQPWMMNMYRSKSEYDIAVIETQARRPVSVKVKQFSLQGARIQNDWQGPQMVKYKNKLHPWKYIVVLPVARNPIKISSPNLVSLKPVHEGIRRVLLAQQRDRGSHGHTAGPVRDHYRSGGERNHNSYDREESYARSQQGYAQQPQQGYAQQRY